MTEPRVDPPVEPVEPGDASLLALIDRLAEVLDRSDLDELEVEAGGTTLLLRRPSVAPLPEPLPTAPAPLTPSPPTAGPTAGPVPAPASAPAASPSVKAPLTGIWYAAPTPGSAPFVREGGEVAVGQVVGLIEAMKLFNEIKSDVSGRVVRVIPENGTLVKAKQPLIEVEPL